MELTGFLRSVNGAAQLASGSAGLEVSVLVGTRPELIKLGGTIRELRRSEDVDVQVIFSGQHAELLDEAALALHVAPDLRIPPLPTGRALTDVLAEVVSQLGRVFRDRRPGCLVVQGDTVSALGGALVSELMDIPLVHLEAGVRSNVRNDPFPEETIRRMISPIAEFNLCLSLEARTNLLAEGVQAGSIELVPHPLFDHVLELSEQVSVVPGRVLMTCHRRERRQARLALIHRVVTQLSGSTKNLSFEFVWHPSLDMDSGDYRSALTSAGAHVLDPLTPPDFLAALARSSVVVTDSAGVAEEAELMGVPLLVLRESAEARLDGSPSAPRLITEDLGSALDFVSNHAMRIGSDRQSRSANGEDSGRVIAEKIVDFATSHARLQLSSRGRLGVE